MPVVLYLISLILALPAVGFAGLVLVIDHVIEVRNPIKLFLDFLLAFGWGVPIVLLALLALVVMAFFKPGQLLGGSLILLCNLAALGIILRSDAAPKNLSEAVFLMPALLSIVSSGWVVWVHVQPQPAPTMISMPVPKASNSREARS
jgi:hypothetical protein